MRTEKARTIQDVVAHLHLSAIKAEDDRHHREAALRRSIAREIIDGSHKGSARAYRKLGRIRLAVHRFAPQERRYENCEHAQAHPEDAA